MRKTSLIFTIVGTFAAVLVVVVEVVSESRRTASNAQDVASAARFLAAQTEEIGATELITARPLAQPLGSPAAPASKAAAAAPAPRELKLGQLRGSYLALAFGYMTCPDVCPTTLAYMAHEMALVPRGTPVKGVFISVDPKRDQPADLQAFVSYFNPDFVGVTGTEANLRRLAKAFGAHFEYQIDAKSHAGYQVLHASTLFIVSPSGELVATLSPPFSHGALAGAISQLATGKAH